MLLIRHPWWAAGRGSSLSNGAICPTGTVPGCWSYRYTDSLKLYPPVAENLYLVFLKRGAFFHSPLSHLQSVLIILLIILSSPTCYLCSSWSWTVRWCSVTTRGKLTWTNLHLQTLEARVMTTRAQRERTKILSLSVWKKNFLDLELRWSGWWSIAS